VRCAECWLERDVVVSDDLARRFDGDLDRGVRLIADALAKLDAQRMMREADTFSAALELDLIDPADFRT
jgi:hypothetical protein